MSTFKGVYSQEECKKSLRAVQDAMYVLSGKWKISILATLIYHGTRRFSDMLNDVPGISNKMLSKELKELEANKLISRNVLATQPVIVQYTLTEYGGNLAPIIQYLADWGIAHRKEIAKS
jgi:DNA-binding HxlR family transcriptional regulator